MKKVWNSFIDVVLACCFVILFAILLAFCSVLDFFESQKRKREEGWAEREVRKMRRESFWRELFTGIGND